MKLSALCCTYLRPVQLGHLIESYLRQDYPQKDRELIILDDAGQYRNQEGNGWKLISISERFNTLGEKRNACSALASPDSEGFLIADDDDIYLSHWFSAQKKALANGNWSRPSRVLMEHGNSFKVAKTGGLYHSGWGIRRELFYQVGGYTAMNNGEDQCLSVRMEQAGATQVDPSEFARPYLFYRVNSGCYHISYMGEQAYQELGERSAEFVENISICWPKDFNEVHIIDDHSADTKTEGSSNDQPEVELIGPIVGSGRNGPQNGMAALQSLLRERIEDGLDWLSIKKLPATRGKLPWFWHWDDRNYANWWNSEGLPFIQGPNLLFTHSRSPRIDGDEKGLLDASNCRMMFCHSEWYRKLIESNRFETNKSPVVIWPYPIDPWPGKPLPDEYDLLVFCKSGYSNELVETLTTTFPKYIRFDYGKFERAAFFEAARRSKASVYLSDDDSGSMVTQELLLAGCPVVGVGTGAPFVQSGLTGFVLDSIPVGENSISSSVEEISLQLLIEAIKKSQQLDREFVRECAAVQFSSQAIADQVISALDVARQCTISEVGK